MNWTLKIKVQSELATENVWLEDCVCVYRKQNDPNFYLERADGLDGTISYEMAGLIFDNRPEIMDWASRNSIYWNRHGDEAMQDAFEALVQAMATKGDE